MATRYLSTIDSPAGPLHIAVTGSGALSSVWFGVVTDPVKVESALRRHGHDPIWDPNRTAAIAEQIREYTERRRRVFEVELEVESGGEWERRVWQALRAIPYGETRSYGQIAALLGDSTKARAVGWANAANPIPLVIPCHRVIGADRGLTGFGGGIEAKIKLLAHEGAMLPGFA